MLSSVWKTWFLNSLFVQMYCRAKSKRGISSLGPEVERDGRDINLAKLHLWSYALTHKFGNSLLWKNFVSYIGL